MLFRKRVSDAEMDLQAAECFWKYFEQAQTRFMAVLEHDDRKERQKLIAEIDKMLCPVFPYEKPGCIGFQLESSCGMPKFILFHSGQMLLAQDMYRLCEMMPESLWKVWTVSLRE